MNNTQYNRKLALVAGLLASWSGACIQLAASVTAGDDSGMAFDGEFPGRDGAVPAEDGSEGMVSIELDGTVTAPADGAAPQEGIEPRPSGLVTLAGGPFRTLPGYDGTAAEGFGLIVRSDRGAHVSLQVNGLAPETAYPAHLHSLPCSLSGGGHYKIDPTVEETLPDNELWLSVVTDESGSALATLRSPHRPREDGTALVIHDPAADYARMVCADLRFAPAEDETARGEFSAFAAAEAQDQAITGRASLVADAAGTRVSIRLGGLLPQNTYMAHVHALPCAVNQAGGHYKQDPAIAETVEANELWLPVTVDAAGRSAVTVESEHVTRPDAQSVVVHRQTADGAPKVACADLRRDRSSDFTTTGTATLLPDAAAAGLETLAGTATMVRETLGTTTVALSLTGGPQGGESMAHVHDRPCAVNAGGAHYKHDLAVTDTEEDNEVWLPLVFDAVGAAHTEVYTGSVLRADARSLVFHGNDGVRLACFELAIP